MNMHTVWLYFISGLTLFLLAGVFPRFAVLFTLLLVLGVVLLHGDEYAALLSGLTTTTPLSGKF